MNLDDVFEALREGRPEPEVWHAARRQVARIAAASCPAHSDDVAQEVSLALITLWEEGRLDGVEHPTAYVRKMVRTSCARHGLVAGRAVAHEPTPLEERVASRMPARRRDRRRLACAELLDDPKIGDLLDRAFAVARAATREAWQDDLDRNWALLRRIAWSPAMLVEEVVRTERVAVDDPAFPKARNRVYQRLSRCRRAMLDAADAVAGDPDTLAALVQAIRCLAWCQKSPGRRSGGQDASADEGAR